MNELIDQYLFELFDGLRDKTTVLFGEFIADAQALAAIFMLLYFGVESFKMMSGDKKLDYSIIAPIRTRISSYVLDSFY